MEREKIGDLTEGTQTGKLDYAKVFGNTCIGDNAKPMRLNSILFLASMTKLLTSLAAMQIIEKGLISLYTDVGSYVPDLAGQPILHGFDDNGKPILTERKNAIRFVHLLTHSAGTAYDLMNPMLKKYRESNGDTPDVRATMKTKCVYPLLFEPGTHWSYGTGIDWAGKVIEKLTNQSLQDYLQENVFAPFGIERIKFTPHLTEEMKRELATISLRVPPTDKLVNLPAEKNFDYNDAECFGGHGCYADMSDYIKILESLLLDDEKLLSKASTATMFSPQLTPESRKGIKQVFGMQEVVSLFVGKFPENVTYDWGIGGVLVDSENDDHRKQGTMIWSGMPNNFWFVDREKGICGLFGTQVYPPGDPQVGKMIDLFEREIYARADVDGSAKL